MTYEEFKKELYRNLQMPEVSQGRQVILLEKGDILISEEAIAMIRLINLGNYGREDMILKEDTICVVWKNQGIQGLLQWNVHPIYERFKREGWQGVLPELVSKLQRTGPAGDSRLTTGRVPESESLMLRPLHYPYYYEELEDGLCWIFGEIALALYLLVHEDEDEMFMLRVNRDMLGKGETADEVLLTNALLNTAAKLPPRLYYGTQINMQYGREYGVFMPGERGRGIVVHPDDGQEGLRGYCVTTTRRSCGAVSLFYPGVKERLAELMDGDYYVGFTSIHEAMVYPARHKVLSELKAAIQRNNILFERREMLTNRVYRYSCSRKELIEV